MLLPFIYDFSPSRSMDQLWVFFSFLTMQKKTHGPLIAPAEFFDSATWTRNGRKEATDPVWGSYNCYDMPEESDLEQIEKVVFPESLMETMGERFATGSDLTVALHREPLPELVDWFSQLIQSYQKQGQTVDAVLSLGELPSINEACSRCGIKSYHFEWGPMRPPTYLRTAYLDECGVVVPSKIEERYAAFQEQKSTLPLLSHQALLALFLNKDYISCLKMFGQEPEYEAGICAQQESIARFFAIGYQSNADMVAYAKRYFPAEKVLFRDKMLSPLPAIAAGMKKDDSISPAQFMCRCKCLLSLNSNMGFEAMLWGKPVAILSEAPYRFMGVSSLAGTPEAAPVEFLNFVLFAFLIPYQRLLDAEYLHWRCTDPSEKEIYLSNLEYYCTQQGLDLEKLKQSGYDAAEILRQKGFNGNADELSIPLETGNKLNPNLPIRFVRTKNADGEVLASKMMNLGENGEFEAVFSVEQEMPSQIVLNLQACAKVTELEVCIDGAKVQATPVNAQKDNVFFLCQNPAFSIQAAKGKVMTLRGRLQEIPLAELAVQLVREQQAENWEANHRLEDALAQIDSKQNQIESSQKWSEKLEGDIRELNGTIQALTKEKEACAAELEQHVQEHQSWCEKLEKDIQELKNAIQALAEEKEACAAELEQREQEHQSLYEKQKEKEREYLEQNTQLFQELGRKQYEMEELQSYLKNHRLKAMIKIASGKM